MCFIDVCYSFTGTLQVCVSLMCVIHSQVHYKYAMSLEDAGRFAEAEAEFIQAGKPHYLPLGN
jgi:hypothetical protein